MRTYSISSCYYTWESTVPFEGKGGGRCEVVMTPIHNVTRSFAWTATARALPPGPAKRSECEVHLARHYILMYFYVWRQDDWCKTTLRGLILEWWLDLTHTCIVYMNSKSSEMEWNRDEIHIEDNCDSQRKLHWSSDSEVIWQYRGKWSWFTYQGIG